MTTPPFGSRPCRACKGTGSLYGEPCASCAGTGWDMPSTGEGDPPHMEDGPPAPPPPEDPPPASSGPDAAEGRRRRDRDMERVERAAREAWKASIRNLLVAMVYAYPDFTSDEVWFDAEDLGVRGPREPRAMGPMMTWASKAGLITWTEQTRNSTRPVSHSRPKRVWRSLYYREQENEG